MDFDIEFDYFHNDFKDVSTFNYLDFPLCQSTPSITRTKISTRSIDYPSQQKHYGIVHFIDRKLPIIYRLLNDTHYIPYIRFSYVLSIFEHSSYKPYLVNIRNLPVMEMTKIERTYYDQLSPIENSKTIDWSDVQLLSVSMLDGTLEIIHFLRDLESKTELPPNQWEEQLNQIRNECKTRWILEEQVVLNRLKQIQTSSLSKTTIAKRRSFFEERLDLSIVNEAGGFVQIDSYIYPYIKNPLDNQIYINLNDVQQNFTAPLTDMISYVDQTSAMARLYATVLQQGQMNLESNRIQHGKNHELKKYLPICRQDFDEIPFLPLQILLRLFLRKDGQLNLQFVQLFENCSLNEIELNYKTNIARQFIISNQRQGGLINHQTACLISIENNREHIWMPTETKTRRLMTNDERLYLNMILLYYGLWKKSFSGKKQWYLKEMNENEKENIHIELLN